MDTTSLPTHSAPVRPPRPLFDYLPIGLFGSVMGLVGLSIAWQMVSRQYGAPMWVADTIGAIAVLAFVALLLAYGWKCITAWPAVLAEFRHPVAGSLFGTAWISFLLVPIVLAKVSPGLARGVWGIGAIGMTVFAWLIVSRWMGHRQQAIHATPAWIVPVVGLLDLPLAMPALGLEAHAGLAVFALALGLFFTIPLFTMIFSRLLFEDPISDAMRPSLMILVAPFAVGYSTYTVVTGHYDVFADALYFLMLFLLVVLGGQMRRLLGGCPFRVSWWSVSFPLAASAICALHYAETHPNPFANGVAWLLLAIASLSILLLLLRTLAGLFTGELRTLSG
ncbi:MAG: SLAC1 anion channel family protein [Bordetella sp.]|nr:SLAC1 anion channel family protein [Bordetella sp.]